ncbi:MAG: hypothetical protein MUC83_09300 [Pirellula sp.]|jgi:hypothetical protein|nr:hypothetical protein [Pirellula sp.]
MAKRKVNKSQIIRDYFSANPSAGPTAIVRGLADQGYDVSVALVSQALRNVTSEPKKRGRPPKAGKASPAVVASKAPESSSVDHLLLAAEYCNKVGSVDAAIDALQALKKIAAKIGS